MAKGPISLAQIRRSIFTRGIASILYIHSTTKRIFSPHMLIFLMPLQPFIHKFLEHLTILFYMLIGIEEKIREAIFGLGVEKAQAPMDSQFYSLKKMGHRQARYSLFIRRTLLWQCGSPVSQLCLGCPHPKKRRILYGL